MAEVANQMHLSHISTIWTLVFRAHGDDQEAIKAAQSALMERYSGTIYRYLLRVLGDPDAADEVFQQFALTFVRGGFRHAEPGRGRFRDYLKVSLLRLVSDYRKKQTSRVGHLSLSEAVVTAESADIDQALDHEFLNSYCDELLARSWQALRVIEQNTGQVLFSVLDYRSRNPHVSSSRMAVELTERLAPDRPFSESGIRKLLQRAREKFADLLLAEVAQTLESPDRQTLEEEVIAVGLYPYCRSAFDRRYR